MNMKQFPDMKIAPPHAPLQCQSKSSNSPAAKARLLLVEDHDVNQILIQAMTRRLGYDTALAGDGTEAVAQITHSIAADNPFDIVLMDIQMPFMDGYEATRIIRTSGISAETLPIIAITANAFGDDVRDCLAAGMQAHISKPVDISNLKSVLQHWLKPKPMDDEVKAEEDSSGISTDLNRRYRLRKEETINQIADLVRKGTFSEREIDALSNQLHKLAGTAAMFGEKELGDHAKSIENRLKHLGRAESPQKMMRALEDFLEAA
jgi:CheY-like chemotaxis protein/HPt (histidine-containing phosphotransfer) domain-containing protein